MDNNAHVSTPTSSSIPTSDPPLGVLSDITNLSAIELRRKRARERYALLSVEDKEARNKKAREKRKQKKEESQEGNQSSTTVKAGDASLGVLSDITNLSAAELRRKRARERYALLSVEDKEARNKKAREKRQQKKEDSQGDNQSATTADGIETRQPMITPRRLSFTVRNSVAHYDDIENNEGPLSCIVQRASQDSLKLDFVRDKSGFAHARPDQVMSCAQLHCNYSFRYYHMSELQQQLS
uniref:Uncharacterized protein n=1 Tax=Oryza glumipatula TaxID=40148 RepID=A0A0D9YHT0_9ORYZ